MADNLPSILVTGASGFVGRHFLKTAADSFFIYGLCRRSQKESGIPNHPNIEWIQADIGDWPLLKTIVRRIKEKRAVDYILHLAGYYDFTYEDHPEYAWSNVNGTRHMLEAAKLLGVKRFIFSSSLAACPFLERGDSVTEQTPAHADFPYARSKFKGEELVKEYSQWFPCSTVRLAAVFSDWCEYPPLYVFLSTWLSNRWNSRILGGRGESAVSYIHVNDVNGLFLTILDRSNTLPPHDTYHASPNGSSCHRHLFETATHYYFGRTIRPMFMPKMIAYPGVAAMDLGGRMVGRRPFERLWMVRYVDRKLNVDSSYTRRALGWEPTPRYHVLRRLLFMIEKMKSSPGEWVLRNEAAMKRVVERANLKIYRVLVSMRQQIVRRIVDYIRAPERINEFPHYRRMDQGELEWYVTIIYRLLTTAARTQDRALVLEYADDLTHRRFEEGFGVEEVRAVLQTMDRMIIPELLSERELGGLEQEIHDSVTLTIRLAMDEIEDCYDRFAGKDSSPTRSRFEPIPAKPSGEDLSRMIAHLDALYEPPEDEPPDDGEESPRE